MHVAWRADKAAPLFRRLRWLAIGAILAGVALPFLVWGGNAILTGVGMMAGLWLIAASLYTPLRSLFGNGPRLTLAMIGMQIAHAGVGLFVIGVTATNSFGIETDQRIVLGESIEVAGYSAKFAGIEEIEGPNYSGLRGVIEISRDGEPVATLTPEKRVYRVQKSPMTEASIDDGWSRDLFVALGEDLGQGAWSIRVQYKPLIRLIWFGAMVMALGGFLALCDRRYRSKVPAAEVDVAATDGLRSA
jgi:cytochrome c-type biogenesis protein CcmF